MLNNYALTVTPSVPDAGAESGIFFPVALRPVEVEGRKVSGFVAVQRQDTGQVFGFHREGYRLLSNAEIFPAFEEALHRSSLDLADMETMDSVSHGGGRTVRQYRFPAHRAEVRVGDLVALQLKVINSYDGALAFSSLVSGHRLACLNGMVVCEQYAQSYGRHTKGFDIASAVARLQQALSIFEQQIVAWQRWAGKTVTDQDVQNVFSALPNSNERLLQKLQDYWQREKQTLGHTVWALFNAVTYWSTHQPVRESSRGNLASIVLQREAQVRSLLNSPAFGQIAA